MLAQDCPPPAHSDAHGFSILELVIAMSIGMVLMVVSIPLLQNAMSQYRVNSTATNVTRIVQLTRSTAIRQGDVACTALDGTFFGVDPDCDGTLAAGDVRTTVPPGVSLTDVGPAPDGMNFTTDPVAIADPFAITFTATGGTTDSPTVDLIYVTDSDDNSAAVTVSGAGRPRTWRYGGTSWY